MLCFCFGCSRAKANPLAPFFKGGILRGSWVRRGKLRGFGHAGVHSTGGGSSISLVSPSRRRRTPSAQCNTSATASKNSLPM
ncbi:hypothetical protein [Lysobacter gummosus]|uniref:hypothetical protein n=1 Tax=Lysobacter gummosus TaxID=262324 RepID=UPI0036283204